MNKIKNIEQQMKKKQKIDINSAKLYNTVKKEIQKNNLTKEELIKKEEIEKKRNKDLINMGVYFKEYNILLN
jgi:hypothetical protein